MNYPSISALTHAFRRGLVALALLGLTGACKDEVLNEVPKDFLSPDLVLTNKTGFDTYITSLHAGLRDAYFFNDNAVDGTNIWNFQVGTDVGMTGDPAQNMFKDYQIWQTPTLAAVNHHWEWAYQTVIPRANTIIDYANRPTAVWKDEAEKNAAIAEARFFRGYTYNILANLYGDVPIVDKVATQPILDFVRKPRKEVYAFATADLEFASQWLPKSTTIEGRGGWSKQPLIIYSRSFTSAREPTIKPLPVPRRSLTMGSSSS